MKPDMGDYYEMLDAVATRQPSLSFLAKPWPDIETWRTRAREEVFESLAFEPPKVPFKPSVDARQEEEDLIVEEISYDMPYGPKTHGVFLYPKKRGGKLRTVVALHDHGEFFYFGKEKITSIRKEPKILSEYKEKYYGGRSWATELAKRGFAVLVVDVFLWGSRRIPMDTVNEGLAAKLFENVKPDSEEYIRKYNEFWATSECSLVVDTILNAGTSWPGIFGYEDRRSIDYLLTRPEIDPNRIACGGLSMGGLRTIFLAGLDARVQCGFCAGFMSTTRALLRNHIRCPPGHGLLMYVPNLSSLLDLPDIIALHAPAPLLVQYNRDDELFTLEGQNEADRKLAEIYSKIGRPENYEGKFHPGAHKFDRAMQEEVFDWLEERLVKD
jgi:dienelactone hydrolase